MPATKKSASKKQEQSEPKISQAVLTKEMLELQLSFLEEHDLTLCFDLRLLDKDGEVFQVKGNTSFPHAMRMENKSVIPKQFQDVITRSLLEPMLQRFNDHIQSNVENELPPPPNGMGLLDGPPTSSVPLGLDESEEDATEDSPPDPSVMS